MSRSQTTPQSYLPEVQHCTRCGTIIPSTATFCGNCGTRVEKSAQVKKEVSSDVSSMEGHVDLSRYRITSLMRKTPYAQLSLAIDTQQQQPVAIRDITIQQIDSTNRPQIFNGLEQEYVLLRQKNIDDVLPIVFSFHTEDHLYSISTWPLTTIPQKGNNGQPSRVYTLQDILQSGIGLPDEQITLSWIVRLAHAIEHLHQNNIVIGTLDPSTILINQKDYRGQPALFASWMPSVLQAHIQQALNTTNASYVALTGATRNPFFSPEVKQGQPEIRSDIYSLGAILYLLVTGIAPIEQSMAVSQPLRSPRDINSRVQATLATTILKALSREPSARFQSIHEFTTALLRPPEQNKASQRFYNALLNHGKTVDKAGTQPVEINISSDKDNNKTDKGKEVHTKSETNDDTVSINPSQNQLARRYMSRVDTQQLGLEQLDSVHEEPVAKNGHTIEENIVGASSTKKEAGTKAVRDKKDDQTQVLSPTSTDTREQIVTAEVSQETVQAAEKESQETQQKQSSSPAAILDIPSQIEEKSASLDDEPDSEPDNASLSPTDSEQETERSRSVDDTDTSTANQLPETQVESTIAAINEVPEIQTVETTNDGNEAIKLQEIEAAVEQDKDEQKPDNNGDVAIEHQETTLLISPNEQEQTQLVALKTQEPPPAASPDEQELTQLVALKTQALTRPATKAQEPAPSVSLDERELIQPVALKTQEPAQIVPPNDQEQTQTVALKPRRSTSSASPDEQEQTQLVALKTQEPAPSVPLGDEELTQTITKPKPDHSITDVPANSKVSAAAGISAKPADLSPLPAEIAHSEQDKQGLAIPTKTFSSLVERVKRFVLGGQTRTNNAVVLIETPMRIQPNKNYTIRIHVMGRDEPKQVQNTKQNNDNAALGGLGSLIHGDTVHIEVRSALYHNYAYIVQQTDVEVPGYNYAAEVTIPMRSITDISGTRRERLHIFFTDEKHNPLYEKPFLIELFISNLVQSGHEGHNVLSIPL